ncbi:MAG: hypothetical protein ACKO2G_11660 [Verrucomicrobiales bacterium]
MRPLILSLLVPAILVVSCTLADPGAGGPQAPAMAAAPGLSAQQKEKIGRRIWQNECAGTIDGLTTWNDGENFPSMGIGHTIWYPAGINERFQETFPQLVRYMMDHGVRVPPWVVPPADCPWPNKKAFLADFQSPKMKELRAWLSSTISVQTDYLIGRQQAALPKMLAACSPADQARVRAQFAALSATPEGMFCLIDYVNFKGEGIRPEERYNGHGWGLLQVLQEMRGQPRGQAAVKEFSLSSDRVLARRIANSPPARGEERWRAGWHNRCMRYQQAL